MHNFIGNVPSVSHYNLKKKISTLLISDIHPYNNILVYSDSTFKENSTMVYLLICNKPKHIYSTKTRKVYVRSRENCKY